MNTEPKHHSVVIPETALIQIAAVGNMGSGDLTIFIRNWAREECKRLDVDWSKVANANLQNLRKRLGIIIGEENIAKIDEGLNTAKTAMGIARAIHKGKGA